MTERQADSPSDSTTDRIRSRWERRKFLAIGGGVGATLFAGCTSDSLSGDDPDDGSEDEPDDGSTDDSAGASSFRLLVSDRPADIDDFDSLEVTFDSARVFQSGGEGEEDEDDTGGGDGEADESGDADDAETDDEPVEEADDEDESSDEGDEDENEEEDDADGTDDGEQDDGENSGKDDDGDDGEGSPGFAVFDLDEPTVDLTEVVGEKAMAVTEGELHEGSYQKLELHVSDVEGIVDGEAAEVKVPSEKLQLTKPFEIREGESVDFVFDINVVKRGNEESYNLKPVISKSGIVGEDLDEHEVVNEDDDPDESGADGSEESEDEETDDGENREDDEANEDGGGANADGDATERESDGDEGDDEAAETDDE